MSGKAWKWIHFVLAFAIIAVWILAVPTGWINSIMFLSHVSMFALLYAAVSSWQGARTEQKQDKALEQNEERDDTQDEVLGTN